jgi:hypothetical protein
MPGTQLISARLHGKIEKRKLFLNIIDLPIVTFLNVGCKLRSPAAIKPLVVLPGRSLNQEVYTQKKDRQISFRMIANQ